MNELQLKYGCNPNQTPSRIFMNDGSDLPIRVLNGRPGYINFLDALNGWQLVTEMKKATKLPAAASFKHVSPAGAAVGLPLNDIERQIYWADDYDIDYSPLACAYVRARGADRHHSEILSPFPTSVMFLQQSLSNMRYLTVSSLQAMSHRHLKY